MGKLAAPVRADKEMMFTNRQLVALMWPLLLEQLLAITVGLADSLMVATVGDAAISAVSLVDSISNLMIYIFSAMATGGAAVAGQYIGQRQKEDACNAGQQLIALLGAVSIFFVALLYLFRTQILTVMFGHIEPDVMAATNTYYLYVMASIPGIALYNGGAALFRTMGHSDVSLKVSLLMNSINVIGNAVLIFGFGMDVAGVAIPTLVSRTVAAIVILSLLFNRDLMLHLSDIRGFRVDMRLMKNIFYIGVPSGVENGMFQLGRLVLFSLISTFGTASMVANAIGNTISNFNCFAGQAINLGLAAVVSQCVGAGEFDQARHIALVAVEGHAAHGGALRKAALLAGKGKIQLPGRRDGIVEEHLVKIADAVKKNFVLMLVFDLKILLHHGRKLCHGFSSFPYMVPSAGLWAVTAGANKTRSVLHSRVPMKTLLSGSRRRWSSCRCRRQKAPARSWGRRRSWRC